jgi:hypothetical protein
MTADHEQPFRVERRGSTAAQRTAGIGATSPFPFVAAKEQQLRSYPTAPVRNGSLSDHRRWGDRLLINS